MSEKLLKSKEVELRLLAKNFTLSEIACAKFIIFEDGSEVDISFSDESINSLFQDIEVTHNKIDHYRYKIDLGISGTLDAFGDTIVVMKFLDENTRIVEMIDSKIVISCTLREVYEQKSELSEDKDIKLTEINKDV